MKKTSMAIPPNPNEQPNWTNPDSGVEYQWNNLIGAWDAVGGPTSSDLTTATLPLANPTRFDPVRGLPNTSKLKTQKDLNEWIYDALQAVDGGDAEIVVDSVPPENPEEGMPWFDNSADAMELFIYVNGAWVSATPNSEFALESRIAVNEEGIRDLNVDQRRQDLEISGIDSRVNQLEGKVGEYMYTFQSANTTPRDGQMVILQADLSATTRWDDAEYLVFNPTTLSGESFEVSEIVTGDVVRMYIEGDIGLQVSAFEVKVVQNGTGVLEISQKVKSVGIAINNGTYAVEHLKSFDPAGLATMDYVDAQDNALKGYVDYQSSETNDKVEEELEALKEYIDQEIENIPEYEPAPVDDMMTLTGTQLLTPGNWRLQQTTTTRGLYSYISIDNEVLKLYHLQEPTASHHAATKKYMDDKVEVLTNSSIPSNNALQSQIDDLKIDVEDSIDELQANDDQINSDIVSLARQNQTQSQQIADLTARLEALEAP